MSVAGFTVLIVDDDDDIRESLAEIVQDAGYAVQTAINGKVAVDRLRGDDARPGVMLLDLMMPVMDGWQVLDVVLREQLIDAGAIVVVTAHRDPRLPAGVECLRKPMSAASVLDAIARRAAAA